MSGLFGKGFLPTIAIKFLRALPRALVARATRANPKSSGPLSEEILKATQTAAKATARSTARSAFRGALGSLLGIGAARRRPAGRPKAGPKGQPRRK
jgi:hypothetical protein